MIEILETIWRYLWMLVVFNVFMSLNAMIFGLYENDEGEFDKDWTIKNLIVVNVIVLTGLILADILD